MRFGTVSVSRAAYYDRAPLVISATYAPGAIAPHANTQRFSYTVPASRKTFIEMTYGHIDRATAAGAAGLAQAFFQYTPNGGAAAFSNNPLIRTNGVGDQANSGPSAFGMMAAGDVMAALTGDNSTTGTVNYLLGMKGTEFDA